MSDRSEAEIGAGDCNMELLRGKLFQDPAELVEGLTIGGPVAGSLRGYRPVVRAPGLVGERAGARSRRFLAGRWLRREQGSRLGQPDLLRHLQRCRSAGRAAD